MGSMESLVHLAYHRGLWPQMLLGSVQNPMLCPIALSAYIVYGSFWAWLRLVRCLTSILCCM